MNTEQERAAFEWWASDEGENPQAVERVGECYKLAQIQSYWMAWQAGRAALQSPEVQAWKRDAERLDWLADPNNSIGNVQLPTKCVTENLHCLRAAIDAAMELS